MLTKEQIDEYVERLFWFSTDPKFRAMVISLGEAAEKYLQAQEQEPVYVVFDGPPSHISGRFVEVETAEGKSVSVGEWKQHGEYWNLGPLFTDPVPAKSPEPIGEFRKDGVIWFGKNPHAHPVGTKFYAELPLPPEEK